MDNRPTQQTPQDDDTLRHFAHLLVTVAMRESARDGGEQQTPVDQAA